MLVLCTVQTMPMSPLTVASSSRMSTLQDSKLAKVSSNSFRAGATLRDANGGISNHSTSDAQCRVLCAPVIDSAISLTMEMMASLSCSAVAMVVLLSSRGPDGPVIEEPAASPGGRCKTHLGACISPRGRSHTEGMPSSLAIGDFSRATHLTIKTLRHYHRIGLLEPADVDPFTGHRRYTTDQIPTAQVIRRFRSLDMPLVEIHAVLNTPDLTARNALIASHLSRLEDTLARTQEAAASLRDLLEPPSDAVPGAIDHRRIPAVRAAAVSEVIDVRDASAWYQGALGELYAVLGAHRIQPAGPAGAIYANDLFTHHRGEATAFVPSEQAVRATGRVTG